MPLYQPDAWVDSGTVVSLMDSTDEVVIGGTAALSSAKFSIDGDTDQIQEIIQGNATQTSSLVVWETSAGTDLMTFTNAGVMSLFRSDSNTTSGLVLSQASTGDACMSWLLSGGQEFRAYLDNSDTDSWKVEDITNADVFIDYDPTGSGTLNLGTAGDISFGDSTLRNATPQSDGKIQLGSSSLGWAGVLCSGNAAVTIGLNRHTTSNTAGNDLTINAGGATSGATDKAGGLLILSPGQTTGTGRDTVKIKGYFPAVSTGTGNNTQVDREIIGGFIAVANNTTTTVVSCTLANGSVVGGVLRYCVEVTNGTDYQVEQGSVSYIVTNKAGAVANNTTVKFGNQQATTSGTLTVTWTITAANPALIQVNANSSLTPSTGFPKVTFNLSQLTQQAITLS